MLLVGVAVTGCESRDLGASRKTVTIDSGGSGGRLAVVYDPGASGYPHGAKILQDLKDFITAHAHLVCGGKAAVARMFVNNNTGETGLDSSFG